MDQMDSDEHAQQSTAKNNRKTPVTAPFLILPTVSFSDWHLLNLPESAAATTGQRGGRGGFRGGGGRLCGGGGIHQVRPSGAVDVRTISSCGVSGVELLSHAAPQLPKPISISMEKAVCFIRFIHVFQFFLMCPKEMLIQFHQTQQNRGTRMRSWQQEWLWTVQRTKRWRTPQSPAANTPDISPIHRSSPTIAVAIYLNCNLDGRKEKCGSTTGLWVHNR